MTRNTILDRYPYNRDFDVDALLLTFAYRTHYEDTNYGDGDRITNSDMLRVIHAFLHRIEQLEQEISDIHRSMSGEPE